MASKTNVLTLECLNTDLKSLYKNVKNYKDDVGFDLYCQEYLTIPAHARSFKIHLGVKSSLHYECKHTRTFLYKSFMLTPRSSMGSKTPLRLSNSVGIIDAGYRGELIAIVDNISDTDYHIHSGDRLVQIVPFDGKGVNHLVLNTVNVTARGAHGLGSTGR